MGSRKWWVLGVIFVTAFFLRFYKLGEIPNGLYQDETAIGYNAYSILVTGKDEHNASWPLYFKSFGDQKLPVYVYAATIPIRLFGLTPFAVRLPSAIFGFLSVVVFFFYLRQLTKNETLATGGALLLAINPWHVFYSRATFEVSIALFFFLAGALSLHARRLFLSVLCFLVALYSYNLTRFLSPLLFFLLFYLYKKERYTALKTELFATVIITIIVLLPFVATLSTGGGAASASGTLIFSSAAVKAPLIEFRSYMTMLPQLLAKIFFNSLFLAFQQYAVNVASYLSVPFFFLTGSPHGNHGIGTAGQFYLVELPLFFLGVFAFFREKPIWIKHVMMWAVATIAVASLTREAPHATRSFFLVVPAVIVIARGLLFVSNKYFLAIVFALFFWNSIYYFASYFIRFPVAYAKPWRSADRELSLFVKNEEQKYDRILIDKQAGFVYSSLLFYTRYPPNAFQATAQWAPDDNEGFSELLAFGKYQFTDITNSNPNTLIITTPDRMPKNSRLIKAFYYPKKPIVIALKEQIIQYPAEEIAYITAAWP